MARHARLYFPGLSVHVIHRGNNRTAIFCDDTDCETFLIWFERAMARHDIPVHVLTLMTTHYHAIVTPPSAAALPNAMRRLGTQYASYYNRKYDRIGTLWAGRYRGIPIGDEDYFLTCFRYIEMNPVRAQMVRDPADYRWSTYRVHACLESWDWLTEHAVYTALGETAAERQAAYRALCSQPLSEANLIRQRLARQDFPATLRSVVAGSGLDRQLRIG
jgi:putative transposase